MLGHASSLIYFMAYFFHGFNPSTASSAPTASTMSNTTDPLSAPGAGSLGGSNPQFLMLDMLIPGFSVFSSALQTYAGIDLNMYIPLIVVASFLVWSSSYISSSTWGFIDHYFMCSVRIRTDDEIFNMIMAWVARQNFSQDSRNFMANTNTNSRSWTLWWSMEGEEDDEDEEGGDGYGYRRRGKKKKNELKYTPSYGSHMFWYKSRLLFFNRMENREMHGSFLASEKEEILISCLWWNPNVLKQLLTEVREQYIVKDEDKTVIYRGQFSIQDGTTWTRCMARASRPFSTVILNEKVKQELITDVTDYLNPATRRWYSNRGIPYRRGYLLYGPPGTGKSSLSLALAGFFGLRIYILTLSSPSATEENVSTLFSSLPRKCVVLLEDIDTAGLTHTREDATNADNTAGDAGAAAARQKPSDPNAPPQPSGKLSLSGLLNILDGVASQEGRVLIMTTNHLEKLDKALIRPGRVDMTVKFAHADSDMAASIFRAIYVPYDGEEVPEAITQNVDVSSDSEKDSGDGKSEKKQPADGPSPKRVAAEKAAALDKVEEMAKQFAAKIPEDEFSPAEIQGLLLKHKRDPQAAIDAVEAWIGDTRKEKAEKKVREAEEKKKQEEEEKKKKEEEEKKKKEEEEKEKEEKEKEAKKKKKTSKKGKGKKKQKEEETDEEDEDDDDTDDEKKIKEEAESDAVPDEDDQKKSKKAKGTKTPSDSGYGTPQ